MALFSRRRRSKRRRRRESLEGPGVRVYENAEAMLQAAQNRLPALEDALAWARIERNEMIRAAVAAADGITEARAAQITELTETQVAPGPRGPQRRGRHHDLRFRCGPIPRRCT